MRVTINSFGTRGDVQPYIALGKGLGNGYPVSAVVMTRAVSSDLEGSGFRYAQSHQNDPLGCAVAREVLAVLQEEGLIERGNRVGSRFLDDLRRLADRHAVVREARGRGLLLAVELEAEGDGNSAISVYRSLVDRGFLVGCKPEARLLRFYPPLTIGEQEIAQLLEHLDDILGL